MEQFLIARPLSTKSSGGVLIQLQRIGQNSRPEPVFDLVRKAQVLDMKEAIVTDHEGNKIATFRSASKSKRRHSLSKSGKSGTPGTRHDSFFQDDECVGQIEILMKDESMVRWDVHKVSRGFVFTHTFGSEEVSFRWLRQRHTSKRDASDVKTGSSPSRTNSDSSVHKLHGGSPRIGKSRSMSALPAGEQQLWVCRLNQSGSLHANDGRRVARLSSEELVLSFPSHSRVVTPERTTSCQVSSALWILLHTLEPFAGSSTPRHLPLLRNASMISSSNSTSPLPKQVGRSSSVRFERPLDGEDNDDEKPEAWTELPQNSRRSTATRSVSMPRSTSYSGVQALSPDIAQGKTKSPTCLTFLQSFKIFSPRSSRQGATKSV